jgi:hypothetical protein
MMADAQAEQQRFCELIRRTVRAKISILVLMLVVLFVIWSALSGGEQKAEEVDVAFCLQVIQDPYYYPSGTGAEYCKLYTAKGTIQTARHAHDNDPPPPETAPPEELRKQVDDFLDHAQQFKDYDWNRRQAYGIHLSLPYIQGPVPLNATFISVVWPFCALLALAAVVALKFKQTCYEIHLSALLANTKSGENSKNFALTEFLAGQISEVNPRQEPRVFLYGKPIGLFPDVVVSGGLFVAVVFLSLNMLTDYSPQFNQQGDDSFLALYYICLYLFFVGLCLLLSRTRRLWRDSVGDAIGGKVKGARLYSLHKIFIRDLHSSWFASGFAIMGLASLFLQWDDHRGFSMLCCATNVADDGLLAAIIFQLAAFLLVLFLVAPLLSMLPLNLWRGRLHVFARRVLRFGAPVVLVYSGFIVFYHWLAMYGHFKDFYLWPIFTGFNDVASLQNGNFASDDLPLGFRLFTGALFLVALVEINLKAERTRK